MNVRRLIALALFALIAIWGACSIYGSSLLLPSPADAGADAGVVVEGGADGDTCQHAYAPERPPADDPDGGDMEVVVALTTLDLGIDAGAAYSFDLDHTCTCPAPESCRPAAGAPKHCDDPQGRDNSGGELVAKFAQLTDQFDTTKINASIAKGKSGLLVRVRHYNGLGNDTSVEVALFSSNGTIGPDGGEPVPNHDGKDPWSASPASLLGGTGPPFVPNFVDANAYVRNHVLVANADFPLRLVSNANPFTLRGTVFSATLVPMLGTFALQKGRFVGRWNARELLTSIQIVSDPFSPGNFLCGNDVTYQNIKSQICKAADISSNVAPDPQAPCDALSIALAFESEPALLAGVVPDTPAPLPCGATYTDQCP